MYSIMSFLLTQKSLIICSKYNSNSANAAKFADNAMIMLIDNTRSLLTALFVTTAQNRFSAAEADIMPIDKKHGFGNHAECEH